MNQQTVPGTSVKVNRNALIFSASTLVVGFSQGAMGQTTMHDIYTTVSSGQVYNLNLNGDGTVNYAIRFDGKSSTDTTTWNQTVSPFVSGRTQDTGDAVENTYVLGNLDAAQSATTVGLPLTGGGVSIGPGYLTAGQIGYIYQDYNKNTVGGWSSTSISDGFVGLELVSNGGATINFGWVEIAFNYNGGNNSTIEIMRAAYDATPNEALITPSPVPEPTTLALTGLAGSMLALRLRNRRN